MHRDIYDVMAGRQVFTPDEWPAIRQQLDVLGVGEVHRVRFALNNPDAGWQTVTEAQDGAQRAPATVDVFVGLP